MSAAPAGHAARKLAADLFSPTTQKPLQSLLSQVYGKPVELNLVNLKRPHLNSDILASLVTQKLKDRANTPRRVIRDVVWKAQLPTKALAKDPSTSSMARAKAPIGHIMHSLRLKQVSSIAVGANGRLGKRMTANRADKKTARKGLTSKGPGFLVRGVRKNHTDYSFRAGKRRVGAFGIKVSVGHS
jgi:ribosomal protein S3